MRLMLAASCLLAAAVVAPVSASTPATTTAAKIEVVADDGHKLALWEKAPPQPRGAILLLHGRTWSSLPNFDLQVAGTPRSVLDALAAHGYAAYALDQRGYGATSRDASGWLTPQRATQDALAAAKAIRARHPGLPAPIVVGYSMGSLTALLAAQDRADAFSALVLYGFPADVERPTPAATGDAKPARAKTTAAAAGEDFVTPDAAPPSVRDAYVQQALASDPVRADWTHLEQFRFHPETVRVPVLLLHGVDDAYAQHASLEHLFVKLGTPDKSWVVLPHSDHAAHVEDSQGAWLQALTDFIERPRPPTAD